MLATMCDVVWNKKAIYVQCTDCMLFCACVSAWHDSFICLIAPAGGLLRPVS